MSYMMEFEINSQGVILENLINTYIKNYCVLMDIPLVIKRAVIVASGSSYNAGLLGKYFFENIANIEAGIEFASEFCKSKFDNFDKNTLYIFISQSGKSSDTLASFRKIKEKGIKTLCITNNEDSPMYLEADYKFNIMAGKENAIAATKTFSASVIMLWLIACKSAQNKLIDISDEIQNIYLLGKNLETTINNIDNLDVAAKFISKQKEFSICGFGHYFPLAREAALKIKETSYINTSSYPMGEFIHGHFALLNKSKVFLCFITQDCEEYELELLNKILTTYKTKALIASDIYEDYNGDILIKIPKSNSKIATIINLIVLIQLLALKVALLLKRDVDKPKGLNKVVDKEK
ncbi:MAG: SIS domain-containing protein [Candidatus Gastranaerophilales bacterium]|nr:SIS domain-containing protein [Candidatus Gastranaerophilales bacterium]